MAREGCTGIKKGMGRGRMRRRSFGRRKPLSLLMGVALLGGMKDIRSWEIDKIRRDEIKLINDLKDKKKKMNYWVSFKPKTTVWFSPDRYGQGYLSNPRGVSSAKRIKEGLSLVTRRGE